MNEVRSESNRLGPERLKRVGGRDTVRIAQRASLALLAVALVWFAVSALRPLPEIEPATGVAPSGILTGLDSDESLDARQQRLASIESRGNIFSADGRSWPVQVVDAPADDESETSIASADPLDDEESLNSQPLSGVDGPMDASSIVLSESPPSAIVRELSTLELRGIYGVDGQLTALIRDGSIQEDDKQTSAYRVGDKVGKAPWDLLAIDPRENRVIVRRAGQTLEVRMYPQLATRPTPPKAPTASTSNTAAPNESGVVVATAEEISQQLQQAGVPLNEINALLRLAESVEMPEDSPIVVTTAPPATGAPAASKEAAPTRAMPSEMVDLLRMMAGDAAKKKPDEQSGEAPAPPPPPKEESDG